MTQEMVRGYAEATEVHPDITSLLIRQNGVYFETIIISKEGLLWLLLGEPLQIFLIIVMVPRSRICTQIVVSPQTPTLCARIKYDLLYAFIQVNPVYRDHSRAKK
jgi:hypothetical protein